MSGWEPTEPGLLCKRSAIRLKRAPIAHWPADPADHRPEDVSDDPAEHS